MKRVLSLLLTLVLMLSCFPGCDKKPISTEPLTENPNGLALEDGGIVYESLAQKAVVKTALAFLARGSRIQYDDTRLNVKDAPAADGTLYRWQAGVRNAPEDYTSQNIGYFNCAAFVHDVYLAALNVKIGATYTGTLAAIDDARRVFHYLPTGKETAEEKAAIEKEFFDNLKMGDIVVCRAHDGINGHTMVYVGTKVLKIAAGIPENEEYIYDCIHSSGTSYSYEGYAEKYEKNGTVSRTTTSSFFNTSSNRYLFTGLKSLSIIRPLNTFDGEVPENSKNRMVYMENIVAEKLSSHTAGMTVNPRDEITYTFSITNKNKTPVTLAVKDTIPENTSFVSSENCRKKGKDLNWVVTVPAGETAEVSYVVKVGRKVKPGQYIESTTGSVGGVAVNCPRVYVGTTLTEEQQAALISAIKTYGNSDLRGMELANALYNEVLKTKDLLTDDFTTVLDTLYRLDGKYYYIDSAENAYTNSIAPGLFGGRYVPQRSAAETEAQQLQRYENIRTRLPSADQLVVGDILIANTGTANQKLFLYTGEKMLKLDSAYEFFYMDVEACLVTAISYSRFVILRPSLLLDNRQ